MTPADRQRHEEALDWVRRIADPGFGAWDAHLSWLEVDPRNATAFDDAALLIEDAAEGLAPQPAPLATPLSANDNPSPPAAPRRNLGWLAGGAGALAASLLAVSAWQLPRRDGPAPELIATAPGQQRTIALADGTRIALNGDSAISLDPASPRQVRLERGEAFFTVVHDAAHPFAVAVDTARFQDVGTAFDVTRDRGAIEVAVREGMVLYDPRRAAVRLEGGQAMRIEGGTATVRAIDPAAAGSWRAGRLIYRDAPLPVVAGDVSRALGMPISVDPALGDRTFSGVIVVDHDRGRTLRRLAAVMGVSVRSQGPGWRMDPARP